MESQKRVVVGKIPEEYAEYPLKKNEVLIATKNAEITEIIRDGGIATLYRGEGVEWYFVDENEYEYQFSYKGGDIQFTFCFMANVAFPTMLIHQKDIIGKDVYPIILDWASSVELVNTISDILSEKEINTENELFESNKCKVIEEMLQKKYQEHFIKNWGMFLNSVKIKTKKKSVISKPAKNNTSPYSYMY